MRRLRTFSLVAVLSAAALCAQAMTVQPVIDPSFLWDDDGTLKIKKGFDFAIDIEMDNPEPFARPAIIMTLIFYGADGVESWSFVDRQGDIIPNIVMTNGFEYYPYPNPWFSILDTISLASYDGTGADTVIFAGSGIYGMPSGEPLLRRLRFWFRIDQEGTFCIDSGGYDCEWSNSAGGPKWPLWCFDYPWPSFNGPHCWEVALAPYVCGDMNDDGIISILDATRLINFLYRSGEPPRPMESGDANADGAINILDVGTLINYLYRDGPPPICL